MSGYGKEYKMSFDDRDNPFKDIIVFSMAKGYYNESELLKLKEELELEKSVSGVYYEIANIDIVKKNLYYISSGIFGFSLLFIIMAFLIMYNDIKLSLTKDTKKIKTMQLVGAGSFFIKRPYLKGIFFNVLEAYFIALLLFTGLLGYLAYSYILLSGMFSVSLILLSALLTLIFIFLFNLFFGNRIIHNFLYKVN